MLELLDMRISDLDTQDVQGLILSLEEKMKSLPDELKTELPVRNHFATGVYGRELFMPAGTLLVGKIHKFSSLNILAKGDIILVTEEGKQDLSAPYIIASKPGVKRVIYAVSNCTWVTCHGTEKTDLTEIEEEFIAKDYSEVDYTKQPKEAYVCLGSSSV